MKITICGSIAFYDEMLDAKNILEGMGHEIDLPPAKIKNENGEEIDVKEYYRIRKENDENWIWERKREAIKRHFDKIVWADAILVLNHPKNGIEGYVGANTLMEMGLSLHLSKPIFLLNEIPEISYKEELLGMQPIIINNDLNKIC